MKKILKRVVKFAAYTAATIVILLAVAVALFRLFLPRLPEYQDDIKAWASAAIGAQVEFSGMDARWSLQGPELRFYGAELLRPGQQTRIVAAEEVGIGVSLMRLLVDRTLVVDTVTVSDTSVEIRRLADGRWLIQGSPADELLPRNEVGVALGSITVIGQNIEVLYVQPGDERPRFFEIPRIVAERDDLRLAVDATIQLPDDLGGQMRFSATRITSQADDEPPWNLSVEADSINLAAMSSLGDGGDYSFGGGEGDFDLSMVVEGRRVVNAAGEVDFRRLALGAGPEFDIRGRIAYSGGRDDRLVAADDLVVRTAGGQWPPTSLRLEAGLDERGEVATLDLRSSYLNLADVDVLLPWLADAARASVDRWSPDGILRNIAATLSDLRSEAPRYSVTAEIERAGFAADGRIPGARGLSGSLRADQDGGLVELNATDLELNLPAFVPEPIGLEVAAGTVIWRRGDARTTILSDSILLQNAVLDSQNNVEIVIGDGAAPVIDLASTWSIADVAAAMRYLPKEIMKPRLYRWFQQALVEGRVTSGVTRLNGPLDKFPFDGDEGRLSVEASVQDLVFRYAPAFPPARVRDMIVALENMRLYSEENQSDHLGNATVDARIEIGDLRRPVLTIDSYTTGTLASIRDFAANSPISKVFGGQLDRVSVDGNAAISFELTMPLTDWRSYEFAARIDSDGGKLAIEGLTPEITELSGTVTVERDRVSSEALGGRFLGEPISIDLHNADPGMPEFRVVASVAGAATASEIVRAFGLPLERQLDGWTEYHADVLFPDADKPAPTPLTIRVGTDLAELSADLPAPFSKLADVPQPLSFDIAFLDSGSRIQTRGESQDDFSWQLDFVKADGAWDFDRGVLALGAEPMEMPDVRGLHIHGQTPLLRFEEWLALSRGEAEKTGVADRIRSIDLVIADLFVLGQHLREHRVRVDRSARDWLVQVDGESLAGSIFVPYDLASDRKLVLEMERLVLPGDDTDEDDESSAQPDPRRFPAITLNAKEFGLGERIFGQMSAEFLKTPLGLASDDILARDESFEIVANGRWVADERDPLGSRSYLTATLTSRNVEATMRRLNYSPGIVSDDMGLLLDVAWSGGPSLDFLETLDGEVQVRFGTGQLDEVEPGAGRMFGLMSIVALPRRLALDFRDVFQKGFGFDAISGRFRIEDGRAYTCDLSLEGPAANIGIIGEANLVGRDYAQTAVVSANVGNTLPVVGALAAGPQAAAALFLFSQIFKKPLQDIGQAYYSVSGSWDSPVVETTNAAAFAASGELAGCLEDSE